MSGKFEVHGTVSPGYESVRDLFARALDMGSESSAQLCIYVGEERVVDLWGSRKEFSEGFDADTLETVFSSTKTLAAICIACLVDKGHLDYGEKVSKYWPEFAQNGKEEVKVCDVLR